MLIRKIKFGIELMRYLWKKLAMSLKTRKRLMKYFVKARRDIKMKFLQVMKIHRNQMNLHMLV